MYAEQPTRDSIFCVRRGNKNTFVYVSVQKLWERLPLVAPCRAGGRWMWGQW